MVGLVLVSHSLALAEALRELLAQVSRVGPAVACAAGIGEDRRLFGTDPQDIARAIRSVHGPDGVLVLMDIGSSLLSAETALELLPGPLREGVALCAAPLVEGAIAAAAQIGAGRGLQAARAEAERALLPKTGHLEGGGGTAAAIQPAAPAAARQAGGPPPVLEAVLAIENEHGLHARPAARFVQTAAAFDAQVMVRKAGASLAEASGASLNALTTLGVRKGDSLVIRCSGAQAAAALEALQRLARARFGERGEETAPPAVEPGTAASGRVVPISAGIAFGPLVIFRPGEPAAPGEAGDSPAAAGDPASEWQRLLRSLEAARQRFTRLRDGLRGQAGEEQLGVFDACLLTLKDPVLLDRVRGRVFEEGRSAAAAWQESIRELLASYRSLPDSYLRQRAADIEEIGRQVLQLLASPARGAGALREEASREDASWEEVLPEGAAGILAVRDLSPGLVGRLDPRRIAGLVAVRGGPASHGAILARALGIPAVGGADIGLLDLPAGTPVALDGEAGSLWVHPPASVVERLSRRRAAWLRRRARLRRGARGPAVTRDGALISVQANAGGPADWAAAREQGAEGIGVLRTEFLYLARPDPPSEREQVDTLRRIGRAFAGRSVRVRTLDIGGDKSVPYLELPAEANPYLGIRSIRHSLRHPEIFLPQLRAILRAGVDLDLQVLFPMVATAGELEQALLLLEKAHRSLAEEGLPHRWPVPAGIMVETPSAALIAGALAGSADFFSIGTNDLTQYTLAAERGRADLAAYADGLHPAVLELIRRVVRSAHRRRRPVTVCGELAGDPEAVPVLLGLGVDALSANAGQIPAMKERIRRIDLAAARELAGRALRMASASQVRRLAQARFP